MKRQVATIVGWLAAVTLWAQPVCDVTKYDEADGVSSAHITQLLQDEQGFMWFATWSKLRFHEVKTMLSRGQNYVFILLKHNIQ